MKRGWIERLLNTVADHSLELVGLLDRTNGNAPDDSELCHRLVEGVGEASNVALAREILKRWGNMDDDHRLQFLQVLATEFNPDPADIIAAAEQYRPEDPDSLYHLQQVTEPPRQELFRRLNMAPGGTATLVNMRANLLRHLEKHSSLKCVDADFQHLLTSWFNRGFLHLERIDWNTPAAVLEKLIRYEVVHPMSGWDDLRRRLAEDRRCFAFFHPALPQDPLIFVEVALTQNIIHTIAPLIDPLTPVDDSSKANTAVFYSINNALSGLRGVSFGNFLIKQVVTELSSEFPGIETYITLSPITRMRSALLGLLESPHELELINSLQILLGDRIQDITQNKSEDHPLRVLDGILLQAIPDELKQQLQPVLEDITLFYLTNFKRGKLMFDPVAHFHLSNGARIERINLHANVSDRGLKDSWGCMVNYRYLSAEVVSNHEAYVRYGHVNLSKDLERQYRQLMSNLNNDTS